MKLKDVCIKGTSNIRQKDINDSGRYPVYGAAGLVGFMNSFQYDEPYVGVVKDGAGIGRAIYLPSNSSIIGTMQALIPKKNVLPKYLYYAVSSMHLEKYYSGATVPHIYFKNYKHERFVLVSKKEQEQIIWRFSLLEKMISNKQQQLLKLDELIKARFVEMFGEFPYNEKGWDIGTIRDLVSDVRYGTSKKASENNDGKYPYLRMNNITYDGKLDLRDLKSIDLSEKDLEKYSVKKDDILFNRTNSKELVGKTCVYNIPETMILAGFIIRVRLNELANPLFVSAFLNTDYSKQLFKTICKNASGQSNINATELQKIKIYIPPISLQNEFADFVRQVDKSKFENIVYLNKTLLSKILSQIGDVIRD